MPNKIGKLRWASLTCLLALPLLSGCGGTAPTISFEESYPYAYVNEAYDIHDVLDVVDGVSYSFDASYQDYYTMSDVAIPVSDFSFTQTVKFDVHLIVSASSGGFTRKKSVDIPVKYAGDPIDVLLETGAMSGWADPGVNKEITQDSDKMHGDDSKSALSISYIGSNAYEWGTCVLSLNNFRLAPLWSDKDWSNAILTFWVYNPNEKPLDFQLRLVDNLTGLLNMDWTKQLDGAEYRQISCAPGVWTHCLFSLHKLGVDHLLTYTEDESRHDEFLVKERYEGAPDSGNDKVYSYRFYVDGVDVVPASTYPEVDTARVTSDELPDKGLENVPLDTGWQNSVGTYDYDAYMGAVSDCSLRLTFPHPASKNFLVLNPELAVEGYKTLTAVPDFTSGTLQGYFMFNDISASVSAQAIYYGSNGTDWVSSETVAMNLGSKDDKGWQLATLDVAKLTPTAAVKSKGAIRICFYFGSANLLSVIHLDTVKLVA
jgi:hypothetical protein